MTGSTDAIASREALRSHYGEPLDIAVACEKPKLDKHHKRFIAHAPFMCLATSGAGGQPSVSPKGDAPGFVHVLDDETLVIPDRPGNNKVESFCNILENPKVSLIFFIPGISESLRIHGDAQIVTDTKMLELGKARSKLPPAAIVVKVTKAYLHCGKALIRSKLWDPATQVERSTLPTAGKILAEISGGTVGGDEHDRIAPERMKATIY